jgi:hypothetical protein
MAAARRAPGAPPETIGFHASPPGEADSRHCLSSFCERRLPLVGQTGTTNQCWMFESRTPLGARDKGGITVGRMVVRRQPFGAPANSFDAPAPFWQGPLEFRRTDMALVFRRAISLTGKLQPRAFPQY